MKAMRADPRAQDQVFRRHAGRLALYRRIGGHRDYWEAQWSESPIAKMLTRAGASGDLQDFEYPFTKYLPKGKRVLEAGCGTGRYVAALRARGYLIEGVDYAEETVRRINEADPSLDVRKGDVYALDVTDGYYGGYISLDVFEHEFVGPERGLKEAHRVPEDGGTTLIAVPSMTWVRRRLYERVPEVTTPELPECMQFYQDHFAFEDFVDRAEKAGFRVLELWAYDVIGAFKRDWRVGRWLDRHNYFFWRLRRVIKWTGMKLPRQIRKHLSHGIMYVCKKVPGTELGGG